MPADFFGQAATPGGTKPVFSATIAASFIMRIDIRDRSAVQSLIKSLRLCAIVHCAAQPSHDLAASRPFDDFDVNAVGTLNLLEAARRFAPDAPFVHLTRAA